MELLSYVKRLFFAVLFSLIGFVANGEVVEIIMYDDQYWALVRSLDLITGWTYTRFLQETSAQGFPSPDGDTAQLENPYEGVEYVRLIRDARRGGYVGDTGAVLRVVDVSNGAFGHLHVETLDGKRSRDLAEEFFEPIPASEVGATTDLAAAPAPKRNTHCRSYRAPMGAKWRLQTRKPFMRGMPSLAACFRMRRLVDM